MCESYLMVNYSYCFYLILYTCTKSMPVIPYIYSILVSRYFISILIRCPFIKSTKRWPYIFCDIGWFTLNCWAKTLIPTFCNYVWPIGIMMLKKPNVSTLDQQYCKQSDNIDLKNDC